MKKADKWQEVIAALLSTRTRQEAAERSSVSITTIYNYLRDPEFIRLYEAEKAKLLNDTTDHLQKSVTEAVNVLWDTLRDPDAKQTDKIAAARILLENNLKYSEFTQLFNRVRELEGRTEDF